MSTSLTENQGVPLSDYQDMERKCADLENEKHVLIDELQQLHEAFKKIDAGIHKASDMAEGMIETRDQNMITDLAINLIKHHPKKISIRYKGSEWKEVYHD